MVFRMKLSLIVLLWAAPLSLLAYGELQQGASCTTTGTRGFPPVPCATGLTCVITNDGKPEVDIPNSGTCEQAKPAAGCECGAQCTMEGGSTGTCQEDGKTCAVNILPPKCQAKPAAGCECGAQCTMEGGSTGTCQEDGKTCAVNILPPKCQEKPAASCECGTQCTMEGGSTGACQEDGKTCAVNFLPPKCPLKVGDLCKSGGIETEQTNPGASKKEKHDACPTGSRCLPKPDVAAIGGEVPHTCQKEADVNATKPTGALPPADESKDMLDFGEVCKSGGVETGPGVNRLYDCPPRSVCAPNRGDFGIGGEVSWTCQKHDNPLPVDAICSTAGSMLGMTTTCEDGLECVLIDAGRPELDVPNLGICLKKGSKLPVNAACKPSSDSAACAPKLQCMVMQGAAPVEGVEVAHACMPEGALMVPMMQAPSGHEAAEGTVPELRGSKKTVLAEIDDGKETTAAEEDASAPKGKSNAKPATHKALIACGCVMLAMVACLPLAKSGYFSKIVSIQGKKEMELRESLVIA